MATPDLTNPDSKVDLLLSANAAAIALRGMADCDDSAQLVKLCGLMDVPPAQAQAVLDELAEHLPSSYQVPLLRAFWLHLHGRGAEAAVAAATAVAMAPMVPLPWNLLTGLWRVQGAVRAPAVTVVIPATGHRDLARAIRSVDAQSYPDIELLLVVDGPQFAAAAAAAFAGTGFGRPVRHLTLPHNTGGPTFHGHRIYAASAFLAEGHFVAFLDEDNWWSPDHITVLVETAVRGALQWAYALRHLWLPDGSYLDTDDCQSLGRWPVWNRGQQHMVDLNCYLLRRDVAATVAPVFLGGTDEFDVIDRRVCTELLSRFPLNAPSGRYTVNYVINPKRMPSAADFFRAGNAATRATFKSSPPWAPHGRPPRPDRLA